MERGQHADDLVQVISTSQLDTKRKVLLCSIFSGGIFVMACGILRAALILTNPITGAAAAGSWAVRETFVSVVIGNLPMIYALVRSWPAKLRSHVTSTRSSHFELVEVPNHKALAGHVSADNQSKHWYDIRTTGIKHES